MKNLNLAQVLFITGEVVVSKLIDTTHYESASNDFWSITIQRRDGSKYDFSIGGNVYSGFEYANLFFIGNLVTVELQDCIEGMTEYIDNDGDVVTHDKTHYHFVSAINTSKVVMDAEGISIGLIKEYLEARSMVSIASQQPKFYAKKTEDDSPERISGLIARYTTLVGPAKDAVGSILISKGYEYDTTSEKWNKK